MKKKFLGIITLGLALALTSCSLLTNTSKTEVKGEDVSGNNDSVELQSDSISTSFSIKDESGNEITGENGIYKITTAGIYTVSGKLEEGQIYVDAKEQIVELDLCGVSISSSSLSPIYVLDCEDIIIKAQKDYSNYIYDNRTTDYSTTTTTDGTSAVFVENGNLKIKGKGELSITSKANSGIHSKDNVNVKNVTMSIKAQNNGIKGNDKVKIEENPTIGIVCGNNGIVTSNSDLGSVSQHGYIYIYGGSITINSYGDGIDAAYAVEIASSTDDTGVSYTPSIDIYTNIYSSYTLSTASSSNSLDLVNGGFQPGHGGGFDGGGMSGGSSAEKADSSAKAIKANEGITIADGDIFTYTYDDGIHTNSDEVLENGKTPQATINITGGNLTLKASDDAIHSDGSLNISGGDIYISEAHEGVEGKIINITDGNVTVFASDDGINASSSIVISGGYVDVNVASSGDYDGIDSNGSITISGGIVITRGPNSEMAAPIDADSSISITGGIVVIVGYSTRLSSNLTKTTSSQGLSSGEHTITISTTTITYSNKYSYSGSVTVYASSSATIK